MVRPKQATAERSWVNSHSTGKATAERGEIAEKPNLCGLCELRGCFKLTHYAEHAERGFLGVLCDLRGCLIYSQHSALLHRSCA